MQPPPLLPSGPDILAVYADASFADEIGVGSWAFTIPAFPVDGSGVEPGASCNRLELSAAVRGISNVVEIDHSRRAVKVFTDSEFVVGLMSHVSRRLRMPDTKAFRPVADLYTEACDLTAGRSIEMLRRPVGDPHHTACDRRARQELRRYCLTGEIAMKLSLARVRERRRSLEQEVRRAEKSLRKLEARLLECDIEIAALTPPVLTEYGAANV